MVVKTCIINQDAFIFHLICMQGYEDRRVFETVDIYDLLIVQKKLASSFVRVRPENSGGAWPCILLDHVILACVM